MLWILVALRLALFALMLVASAQLVRMAAFGWSRRDEDRHPTTPIAEDALPLVTVQLPIRNERYVAERVVRAACALDWPSHRLQIQVLDDSDDDTSALLDRVVAEEREKGRDIAIVRREDRRGFKAGHLQNGLSSARGEILAVLDADCVAPRDFLRRLVPPLLADPQLGFVQGRWSFDNEEQNLLTRLQALILHGLMLIEQHRLSRLALPLQFNGTGGVFRRQALLAAGGWLPEGAASVAEDLDLSYRARLCGYRGLHLPEVAIATELPATMAAFRAQQSRWVRGGAQVLRTLGRKVAREPSLGATMLAHLLRHGRQPLLALFCLSQPLVSLGLVALPEATGLWAALLALLLCAIAVYYGAALVRLGRPALRALLLSPILVALSLGLSLCLSRALVAGLFADRGAAEFVRTPKAGAMGSKLPMSYRTRRDPLAYVEVALGLLHLCGAGALLLRGDWAAAMATAVFLAGGLLWVGISSLRA